MKNRINSLLVSDKHIIEIVKYQNIHIVDMKNFDSRDGIKVFDKEQEVKSVRLINHTEMPVAVDKFEENALPSNKKGLQVKQCECCVFPENCDNDEWVLFIETKYARNNYSAFRRDEKGGGYPNVMIEQILSTVEYFREKGVIKRDKLVNAIVSFPELIDDFSSTLFIYLSDEYSIENLVLEKKVRLRGTNFARIRSSKMIDLISVIDLEI